MDDRNREAERNRLLKIISEQHEEKRLSKKNSKEFLVL